MKMYEFQEKMKNLSYQFGNWFENLTLWEVFFIGLGICIMWYFLTYNNDKEQEEYIC